MSCEYTPRRHNHAVLHILFFFLRYRVISFFFRFSSKIKKLSLADNLQSTCLHVELGPSIRPIPGKDTFKNTIEFIFFPSKYTEQCLKVALQILGQKFYKNTKKSSLYSQSLLIFIHRTPVVERYPITREIRDLLWPRSTATGNTVYFYMSSSFIYTLEIHRRSFKHSVR